MVRKAIHTKPTFIPIIRPYTPHWKIEIIRSDSTVDDVTDERRKLEWNLPVTEKIGRFKLTLDNNAGTWRGLYTGGETIKIYYDWVDGTTKKWEGVVESVEDVFKDEYLLELKGIHVSGECLDITVTEEYSGGTEASVILKAIIDKYLTGFTYTNVDASSIYPTIKWDNKPFWECVVDLCNLATFDAYVDDDKDFYFFAQNSNICTLDAVIFGDNLLENEGLGVDILYIKNRIIVYGEDENRLPIIYVDEDSTSQSSCNIKEKIIKDTSISTMQEAEDRATAELAELKSTVLKGKVKSYALMGVNPGDKMWISMPIHDIHAQYRIIDIRHSIPKDGLFRTECEVAKPTTGIPRFFRERMQKEMGTEVILNPNALYYSYNEEFNSSGGTHTNTKLSGGKLQLSTGESSGNWISDAKTTNSNVTKCEFRAIGQDLESCTFEVSADNGVNYKTVTRKTLTTIDNTGTQLKFRINLVADADNLLPIIESCVVLYT